MKDTFILIKSCWAFKKRRDAIRETWLTQLDRAWADYAFVLGAHEPIPRLYGNRISNKFDETDIQAYLEDDSHRIIGRKLQHAFRDLVGRYEKVIVLDDDTYVIPSKLAVVTATVQPGDYVGFLRNGAGSWGSEPYMQGSAYILGSAALYACACSPVLRSVIPDDVAVGKILYKQANFIHEEGFDPGPEHRAIWMCPSLITTHKVKPAQMIEMHLHVLEAEANALQHLNESL